MLRGQLSLYSGHPEDAVSYLQNATRMARETGTVCVSAESMLTIAYLHAGRLRDQVVQSCKVDSLPLREPVDPYDCLFKAQGYIAFPHRGLEILDQAYPTGQAQTSLSLAVRLNCWRGVVSHTMILRIRRRRLSMLMPHGCYWEILPLRCRWICLLMRQPLLLLANRSRTGSRVTPRDV